MRANMIWHTFFHLHESRFLLNFRISRAGEREIGAEGDGCLTPFQYRLWYIMGKRLMWCGICTKRNHGKISNMCVCCYERFTQGRRGKERRRKWWSLLLLLPSSFWLSLWLYGCMIWLPYISQEEERAGFANSSNNALNFFFGQKPILEARSTSFVLILLGLTIGSLCLRH